MVQFDAETRDKSPSVLGNRESSRETDQPCRLPLPGGRIALVDAEDFTWLNRHRWRLKYDKSGRPTAVGRSSRGYTDGRVFRTMVWLHREVMGARPGQWVDHVHGDVLDNRKSQLRFCTPRQNSSNVTRSKNQKRGGFKGVSWNPRAKKWQACIGAGEVRANGKRRLVYLGLFKDPADAARAYDAAAVKAFGEFAALNFPANDSTKQAGGAQ